MVFTLLLWCTAAVIYFSGRENKVNQWCVAGFLIASLGTLKEFLMESAVPMLLEVFPLISLDFYMTLNSWMTAVLYLGIPFCFITLAMCFNETDERRPAVFCSVHIFTAILIAVLMIIFLPWKFKLYQQTSPAFWYSMSVLNLGYGLAGTVMMVRAVRNERREQERRRKKLLTEILLPPYCWWLTTIFVIHTLRMYTFMKAWKANIYVALILFIYYLYIVLREGMMGIRFGIVVTPWDSDIQAVDKSTHYINHMIKHQTVKIDWCVNNLREKQTDGKEERELDIIERSSRQLREFSERTTRFLNTEVNDSESVQLSVLAGEVVEDCRTLWKNIIIDMEFRPDVILYCDVVNMKEVLLNLLENSRDAMEGTGKIQITGYFERLRRVYCIKVTDTGRGMSDKTKAEAFAPYFTTKQKGIHYGLGLAFCKSILQAHGGKIKIESVEGQGTKIILCFPRRRVKKTL